jgi:FkbM family methyltransferase
MIRLFDLLRGWRAAVRDARLMPCSSWRRLCVSARVPLDEAFVDEAGCLRLRRVPGLAIPPGGASRDLLSGYRFLADLVDRAGASVRWDAALQSLILEIGACRYPAACWEELCILAELYLSGDYDFLPRGPTLLVDIGANVGFTSIFLAAAVPDLLVEAFEPVPENHATARRNLDLNAQAKNSVRLHNVGLHVREGTVAMRSEPGHRGCSRVLGDSGSGADAAQRVTVAMRCALDVLRSLRTQHAGRRMFVKLDCEGSEYAILRQLSDAGELRIADAYLMEWHRGVQPDAGPDALRALLSEAGFHVLARHRLDRKAATGMMLAVKAA